MSAEGYYGNDPRYQSNQGYGQQGQYPQDLSQHYSASGNYDVNTSQDRANPYGYPESGTPQQCYDQPGTNQHPPYDPQYQPYAQPTQPYRQYNQDYGSYSQQQYPPPSYDQSYPPQALPVHKDPSYGTGYQPAYLAEMPTKPIPRWNDTKDPNNVSGYPPIAGVGFSASTSYGPPTPHDAATLSSDQDRGLMGAIAGGALGAYGGHQMGHGVIGAVGGAIAGSKLEDHYKDKDRKKKHRKHRTGSEHGSHREERREDRDQRREARQARRRERGVRRGSRNSSSSSSSNSSSSSDSGGGRKKTRRRRSDRYAAGAAAAGIGAGGLAAHHRSRSRSRSTGGGGSGYRGNFSSRASNITLDRDYDLIALCADRRGKEKLSSIHLNQYLANEWGRFRWVKGGNVFASARNVRLVDSGRVLEAELGDGRGGWRLDGIRLDERIGVEDGELVFVE